MMAGRMFEVTGFWRLAQSALPLYIDRDVLDPVRRSKQPLVTDEFSNPM